ncbi:MAG: hypothetical protein PHV18_09090 [Lachnospiraceae bacterium]|nr:hypothetical protein [Lachnospiraceae bacterium]
MKKKILLAVIAMSLSCSFMSYAATGWIEEGERWHYYKDEATLAVDCFVRFEDSVCYLDSEGNMVMNQEIQHDGKQYSLNEQGQVVNSWVYSWDSCYYYADASGKLLMNTTTPDGYHVDANGVWNPDASSNEGKAEDTYQHNDEELGYQALKLLYKTLSNPSVLEVGYVKCMDISYAVGNGDSKKHTDARLVLINYSASSSFGASMDKYYGYEVKSDGSFLLRTDPMKVYSAATLNSATNIVTLDQTALLKRIVAEANGSAY